jgi:hypothetical protein
MKSLLKMMMLMWFTVLSLALLAGGDCSVDIDGEGDVDVDVKPLFLE